MHGNLLVLLSAAWLGPLLLEWRGQGSGQPGRWLPAAAIFLAGLLAFAAVRTQAVQFALVFAFAALLLWLGDGIARAGRRPGLRRVAVAVGGGLLAVGLRAAFLRQPLAGSLLPMVMPALLLVLLAPAAAAMTDRIRDAQTPSTLRGAGMQLLAASALALGLAALWPPSP